MVRLTGIKEGLADVLVPAAEWKNGPNSSKVPVFYNPTMEFNRDLSVSLLKAAGKSGWKVLDGLAASGIRGIRFALETGGIEISMNDRSAEACSLMKKNAERNGVKAEITCENLNAVLSLRSFDYIDIDPFGSPAQFIDAASRAVRNNGILAITATDTAVLCGVYPGVCHRRYMANPAHNWCMHETGLRILVGSAVRIAARNDMALRPVLSYSADHYFRAYLRAEKGAKKANGALNKLDTLEFTEKSWKLGGDVGPLWAGALFDRALLENMKIEEYFGTKKRMGKMLDIWKEEADMPLCYHELSHLSSMLKMSMPPLESVLSALREKGYRASKTHFSPTGVKTDAGVEEVERAMRQE